MRARTALLGSVPILVAADAAAMLSLGSHLGGGPHHGVRIVVCLGCAFLVARRSGSRGDAARAVAASFASAALAVLVSTTAYVLYGGAAANRHGPAILLTFMGTAGLVGLELGAAGAAAGWYAHRRAHAGAGEAGEGDGLHGVLRRRRGPRRKFP